jgi:hypothetical protein
VGTITTSHSCLQINRRDKQEKWSVDHRTKNLSVSEDIVVVLCLKLHTTIALAKKKKTHKKKGRKRYPGEGEPVGHGGQDVLLEITRKESLEIYFRWSANFGSAFLCLVQSYCC